MEACELPSAKKADKKLCEVLKTSKVIVIVGLSPKPHRASHQVAKYLQEKGYKIIPVYPREEKILGERVYRSLDEIDFEVDIVDIFRKSEDTPPIVEKAVKLPGIKCVFLQEGVKNEEAKNIAQKNGIFYVEDKCIMVEHKRCESEGLI
ncbi:CoA-binding protein [Caminibacter mediatlanticus TB-2]|uniref:CoA-binding protein n=1 Tax=Caminibacter mediatlanticus TB-2 TaxID=391592 RepID=A0ABX5VAH6_9BACT|nr:CoA-binding protein [Caminibacter mediatlanticus]QCT94984.1 CoA-binding protein [Caminibacter mediatlanticus TB-2]